MLHGDTTLQTGSYWQKRQVSINDLPTLQELLFLCDKDVFVRVVSEEFINRDTCSSVAVRKKQRPTEARLLSTLSSMCSLSVKRRQGRNYVVLPKESFLIQKQTGLIERRVEASRIKMQEDVAFARKFLNQKTDKPKETSSKSVPVRSFALDPWEVVLASRVWLWGSWCQRELYIVLAHAFWEMTFFGYEYDQVVAAQTTEKASRLLDVSHSDKQPCATVTQENRRRSFQFGLTVINQFDAEYFNRTAACVGEFNARAQIDVCRRIVDLAQRAGLSNSMNCD